MSVVQEMLWICTPLWLVPMMGHYIPVIAIEIAADIVIQKYLLLVAVRVVRSLVLGVKDRDPTNCAK